MLELFRERLAGTLETLDVILQADDEAREQPRGLTLQEAATRLGIGKTTTGILVRSGKIRSVRVGKRLLIPVDAIAEFLAEDSRGS